MLQKHYLASVSGESLCRLRPSAASKDTEGLPACVQEEQLHGMTSLLDSLKWNHDGLVAVIVQVGGSRRLPYDVLFTKKRVSTPLSMAC